METRKKEIKKALNVLIKMKNQFAEIRTYDKQPKEKPLKVILCCLYLLKLVNVKLLDSPSINNYK